MPIVTPSWLKAPDVAADYTRGLSVGTQLAEARMRIEEQQRSDAMRAEIHAQEQKRNEELQKARLATQTQYRQQQFDLQKQRLEEAAKVNALRTRDAAQKLADQQGFAMDVQGGMSVKDALFRHPRLATPANAIAAHKDALGLDQKRLDASLENIKMRKEGLELQKKRLADEEAKSGRAQEPHVSVRLPPTDLETGSPGNVSGPLSVVQQQMGTNMPAQLRAGGRAPSNSPFKEGQRIRNKKDGRTYVIRGGTPVPEEEDDTQEGD